MTKAGAPIFQIQGQIPRPLGPSTGAPPVFLTNTTGPPPTAPRPARGQVLAGAVFKKRSIMCCWFCESPVRLGPEGFYCPFGPCPACKAGAGVRCSTARNRSDGGGGAKAARSLKTLLMRVCRHLPRIFQKRRYRISAYRRLQRVSSSRTGCTSPKTLRQHPRST